jgi:endonuclease-3 related protein
MISQKLNEIYQTLLNHFGHQNWWPANTDFEVVVGAILTQNTNWQNVEKAIKNLIDAEMLDAEKIHHAENEKIAQLIKPSGYYKLKTKRLKNFLSWLFEKHNGDITQAAQLSTSDLRQQLLSVNGIGPETADSILLFAFQRPVFVVDTYTARVAVRHQLIDPDCDYDSLQYLFQNSLDNDTRLFSEFHALIVNVAKEHCKKNPICENCPLEKLPHTISFYEY